MAKKQQLTFEIPDLNAVIAALDAAADTDPDRGPAAAVGQAMKAYQAVRPGPYMPKIAVRHRTPREK